MLAVILPLPGTRATIERSSAVTRKKTDKEAYDLVREHGVDATSRTLYLFDQYAGDDEVDSGLLLHTLQGLRLLRHADSDAPITVFLSTRGGHEQAGLAIYHLLRSSRAPITLIGLESVQSMGTIILQAASRRLLLRNTVVMFHEGSADYSGHPKVIDREVRYYKKMAADCDRILLERIREKHPGFTTAQFNRLNTLDTILTAEEAVALGLADEVVDEVP
jgi:ATP-dependent Clp protease protease subunit